MISKWEVVGIEVAEKSENMLRLFYYSEIRYRYSLLQTMLKIHVPM